MRESEFEFHFKKCIQLRFPKGRVFNREVGVFKSLDGKRIIRVGVKGMSDLVFLHPYKGVVAQIDIELKTSKGKKRKAQENYANFIDNIMGGLYLFVRPETVEESFVKIENHLGL